MKQLKTGIMATVADVRCTPQFVEALFKEGMTGVRINSAHVSPDTFKQMVRVIKGVCPDISILMDTKGPEIRTTAFGDTESLVLNVADHLTLRSSQQPSSARCVNIAVDRLEEYVTPGGKVIMDDGEIELEIARVNGRDIECRVTKGGILGQRKTIAFPGIEVPPLPSVSQRDRLNIAAAKEMGIEMIAHSFVRSKADVEAVRELLCGSPIKLYSKIECKEALENLEEITEASDGLLVARGDLGTSIPLYTIPMAQLRAVAAAHRAGKPTILATQILQSMISSPTPTRAELSDITLAVMEGIDRLLLTGETAQGKYPRECVEIMRKTIEDVEGLKGCLNN